MESLGATFLSQVTLSNISTKRNSNYILKQKRVAGFWFLYVDRVYCVSISLLHLYGSSGRTLWCLLQPPQYSYYKVPLAAYPLSLPPFSGGILSLFLSLSLSLSLLTSLKYVGGYIGWSYHTSLVLLILFCCPSAKLQVSYFLFVSLNSLC